LNTAINTPHQSK